MAAKTKNPLQELHSKSRADGNWPVFAATQAALADESNLDSQINVIGAMHESGFLRNRIEPFWKLWRKNPAPWAARCIERLRSSDRDYWAAAALLGLDIRELSPILKSSGYKVMSVRAIAAFVKAGMHIAVLTIPKDSGATSSLDGGIWAPVLEIGWDASTGEVSDVGRWRAIMFDALKKKDGSIIGKGDGTNFIRAALPHGSWRVVSAEFDVAEEAVIPLEKTLLKKL